MSTEEVDYGIEEILNFEKERTEKEIAAKAAEIERVRTLEEEKEYLEGKNAILAGFINNLSDQIHETSMELAEVQNEAYNLQMEINSVAYELEVERSLKDNYKQECKRIRRHASKPIIALTIVAVLGWLVFGITMFMPREEPVVEAVAEPGITVQNLEEVITELKAELFQQEEMLKALAEEAKKLEIEVKLHRMKVEKKKPSRIIKIPKRPKQPVKPDKSPIDDLLSTDPMGAIDL